MTDMAYIVEGPPDAPAVVFLHSLGSNASMWRPQAEALAGAYRVVRIDTRGHGDSPSPTGTAAVDDLGRDVIEVADAEGLDTFHLVGLSLGGLTSLWVALHHAARLRSLTAANTAARVANGEFWQARIDAVREQGLAGICDAVVGRFFGDGFAEDHPDWYAEARDAFVSCDPEGYIACCGALADTDLRDDVGRIDVPTLVVGGDQDVATPPADALWLQAHIDDSRLAVLPRAAHLSNLDQPGLFTQMLRAHLEEFG